MAIGLIERAPTIGVAEAIQFKRVEAGLSRQGLGLRAALSQSYIGKVERGEVQPSLRAFASIAQVLQMHPLEIYVVIVGEAMRTATGHALGVTPPTYDESAS